MKTNTLLETYLFMIDKRLKKYSHLPHQVANNDNNCKDRKLLNTKFYGTQVC